MQLLLDTHVFLWLETSPERIDDSTRDTLEDTSNELFVSAATVWEIVIKHTLGKLTLPTEPQVYVTSRIGRGGYGQIDFTMEHALAVGALPLHHKDPFDRMLAAQAHVEGLTLVTADERILRYPIRTLRA